MPVLSTWSPVDPLLGVVAPLALAASVTTAIVVDLDPDAPPLPAAETLADLIERGPSRSELSPQRHGIAVLGNGGIDASQCRDVLAAFERGWPHVVYRIGYCDSVRGATVPVLPLLPRAVIGDHGPAVYQRVAWSGPAPEGSLVMPRPAAGTVSALLDQRRPMRGPWLRSWRRVWRMTWA